MGGRQLRCYTACGHHFLSGCAVLSGRLSEVKTVGDDPVKEEEVKTELAVLCSAVERLSELLDLEIDR